MLKLFQRIPGLRPSSVTFDEQRVVRTMTLGRTESVRWDELEEVGIVTTDQGPFVNDVFWLLLGEQSGCSLPSEIAGMDELLRRLQLLPGFDNAAVIRAMSCTENASFVVWRRDASPPDA